MFMPYECMYVCAHMHPHINVHLHTSVSNIAHNNCMYVHVGTCVCMYVDLCMSVCMYEYICVGMDMHLCMYTYGKSMHECLDNWPCLHVCLDVCMSSKYVFRKESVMPALLCNEFIHSCLFYVLNYTDRVNRCLYVCVCR